LPEPQGEDVADRLRRSATGGADYIQYRLLDGFESVSDRQLTFTVMGQTMREIEATDEPAMLEGTAA